ncbi:MAG: protein-tyrosine-phosphatase [Bacteroidota bacterium]
MYDNLDHYIRSVTTATKQISEERKKVLNSLTAFINQQLRRENSADLLFICTHNSRRSHMAQIWAQVAAHHFGLLNLNCYSGGTAATAMYTATVSALRETGLLIEQIPAENASLSNPVYSIKYDKNKAAIIGFSKTYDHSFNPSNGFAAVMTCSQADADCPFIPTAAKRIALPYDDPKVSDGSPAQKQTYADRCREIAQEMFYAFSQVKIAAQ